MRTNTKVDNSKVIGFDLDGVIVDHTKSKIKVSKAMGFDVPMNKIATDHMRNFVPKETWRKIQNLIYDDPKYALNVPVMSGMMGVLRFVKSNYKYYLISRRSSTKPALDLLKRHKLWPEYFNKKNTFFVNKPEDKNVKAIELGITHYLDDQPRVLNVLTDVPNRFLLDPLNSFEDSKKYIKINSPADFISHIKN